MDQLTNFDELYNEFIDSSNKLECHFIDEYHCFNGYVIIPVKAIERSIDINSADDIEISTPTQQIIGFLCPLAYSENEHIISQLNEIRLFAYFVDSLNNSQPSDIHSFRNHYVAIKSEFYEYYKTVMSTSEYWGGYTHKDLNSTTSRVIKKIQIHDEIKTPSLNHEESIVLAIHSTSSFERFLKYYHQIELLFDSLFIAKLKNINSTDLKDYSIIIKEFNQAKKSEIESFKYILKKYISNYTLIIEKMKLVQNHLAIANEMFFILGKDTNPLKSEEEWILLIDLLSTNSFNSSNCSAAKKINGSNTKLISKDNQETFNAFVINLCSYWIYRMRCCIAHNKLGEYIFSYNDEGLVSEFGEHLLLEIIKDIFSNTNLHSDLHI